jgi:hypothetical protein
MGIRMWMAGTVGELLGTIAATIVMETNWYMCVLPGHASNQSL